MSDPSEFPPTRSLPRVKPQFGIWPTLRGAKVSRDGWYFRALGVVIAAIPPLAVLAVLDRVDLAVYTMAGSMAALFTHTQPYRHRAASMAGFVAMLTLACGVSMAAAATSENMFWRIGVAVLLAAIIKVAHDASTVGPPPAVIPIFLVTALAFTPQHWGDIPMHLALIAGSGVVAWIVVMAPALVRPHGPERRAVATAMLATIPVGKDPHSAAARDSLAGAITAAWRVLSLSRTRTPEQAALEAHLIACSRILAEPQLSNPERARQNAHEVERSRTALPAPPLTEDEQAEIRGMHLEQDARRGFADRHPILAAFRPSSPSMPFFWRVFVGCLAAALVSYALGADRPFWAIVSAAVIIQPNLLLTWRKAPPRALGAVLGVGLFALLAPVAHIDPVIAAAMVLALNAVTELFIARNYLIAQLFVTPMALLMSQFGAPLPSGELIVERVIDTVIGVVMALAAAFLIRNGHLRRHAKAATERLEQASEVVLPADASPAEVERVRRELVARLAAVAAAVRDSDSEWWTHRVDETRVIAAQRRARAVLASLGDDPGDTRRTSTSG